ncbi:hypothetical protein DASC09_052210 [Saccharomycopsis crataegensis]|uniref:LicD/FKTN/FKRP nucleotidyltransferase domain-containing protein n=1 Tax=Saccharomycopsis crataegensis TaxID=43959 RepID=A0AAV5QTP1_9ASCO|nr:hypothetical protein DASC09_052210 [Saccharomycopsis crataegensis]
MYKTRYLFRRLRKLSFPILCALSLLLILFHLFGLSSNSLDSLASISYGLLNQPHNYYYPSSKYASEIPYAKPQSDIFNLYDIDTTKEISELSYYQIFNPYFENQTETFNEKLTHLVKAHNIRPSEVFTPIDETVSQVKIPAYFIEDYLLKKLESSPKTISKDLRSKIISLKHFDTKNILKFADRHLPLFYNYDYRLSLAIYSNYIRHHVTDTNNLETLMLPFSWYDFTDLSIINEDIKLQYFWNWLLYNYQNFPQTFKNQLLTIYFGEEMTQKKLDSKYDSPRRSFNLNLDNFEMFLRQFNIDMNSCEIFLKDDAVSTELIEMIDDLYSYNFVNGGGYPSNKHLKSLESINIKDLLPSDLEKINAITKSRTFDTCQNFNQIQQSSRVDYPEYITNQNVYQPGIGFNVIHGTRDKFHLVQRVMYAKSYLYNYNGINNEDIKPFKLTILADSEVHQVTISQNKTVFSERLLENGMIESYIENELVKTNKYTLESLWESKDEIFIDFIEEFNALDSTIHKSEPSVIKPFEETDEDINWMINYVKPKTEVDFYIDSFVNIDSADAIQRFHSRVPQDEFFKKKNQMAQSSNNNQPDDDIVYEKIFEDNLASTETSNPLRMTRNLFKFYKSIKFSNGFVDVRKVPKYFYEIRLLPDKPGEKVPNTGHFDWRFFTDHFHSQVQTQNSLSHLLGTWLTLTKKYKLNTWIAHGTLLGWYFNAKNLAWDTDMDVQMPINDLNKLCLKFNQSVIIENPKKGLGMYFLDCGSSITHRSKENGRNNIDARLIDTKTGFYIDITGVSFSGSKTPNDYFDIINWEEGVFHDNEKETEFNKALQGPENQFNREYLKLLEKSNFKNLHSNLKLKIVNCRNNHFVELEKLLPLRKTLMEGVEAYVPNDFTGILQREYKIKWNRPSFGNWIYIPKLGNWIRESSLKNLFRRFLAINENKINPATYQHYPSDSGAPMLNDKIRNYYSTNFEKQLKLLQTQTKDQKFDFKEEVFEQYGYPFNFTRDSETFMILEHDPKYRWEFLLSKQLVEYHEKELLAFKESKSLSDQERKSVNYKRPDFYLQAQIEKQQEEM